MSLTNKFLGVINGIKGQVVAIVYTFEGENALGFEHYDVWRSNVICDWVRAVEELGCKPFILDVRTFVLKAMMNTLPHIDYVINLNAGNKNLGNLSIIPSVCSFLGTPCIPCNSEVCAVGEDKIYANMIAKNSNIKVPVDHPYNEEGGIIRPRSYGSSIGIRRTSQKEIYSADETSQQFIVGMDVTFPILYNPIKNKLDIIAPIAYRHMEGFNCYLDAEHKLKHDYTKERINITDTISKEIINLVSLYNIKTFCRIDTRIATNDLVYLETATLDNLYFIEINPTPTIHNSINFTDSLDNLTENDPHYLAYQVYKQEVANNSKTGYVLACALCSFIARHSR